VRGRSLKLQNQPLICLLAFFYNIFGVLEIGLLVCLILWITFFVFVVSWHIKTGIGEKFGGTASK
jgi:hypothetical protein